MESFLQCEMSRMETCNLFQPLYRPQKQLLEVFFKKGVFKLRNIYRKTPVLEFIFNQVTGLKGCNFMNKRLQHKCFPVNIAKFLRTAFIERL